MTEPTLKIGPSGYKLNPVKLAGASQSILPYVCGAFYYTEDYEYFDVIQPYLDIPEKPKTLEELEQELDEKFDDLLVRTKRKFAVSKETAEYHYNRKFETINGNFEYAKSYGYFPQITFLDSSKFSVNRKIELGSPSFVVKNGINHQGYYTIGEDRYYRFYMEKKPNMIFRFFVYKLMGFKWIDEVLK
jgi:hypothetical protein